MARKLALPFALVPILAAAVLAAAASPSVAHPDAPAGASATSATAATAATTASTASAVQTEMLFWIDDAAGKLGELAKAMPEDKYSWRPGEGVRSVGEVYMHVAAANFGVPSFSGVKAPAGFSFAGFEQSKTKKDEIVQTLNDSFKHMENALKNSSAADLEKPAELFGMKTTVRGTYMLLLSHAHEHLGQSIAYARTNGVVPPWTAREQAAAKAAADKKSAAGKE